MFRGARLVIWFDLTVILVGIVLLLDYWRPLTGSTIEATLIKADPVCKYSVYVHKPKSYRRHTQLPTISGKCVETEKEAKQLLKTGYNQVSKGWMATAEVENEKRPMEFYLHDSNWLATKESWQLFQWGERQVEIGCRVFLLRSADGYTVTQLNQPQTLSDKLWALYIVILGTLLSFGTLAIHAIQYLQSQRPRRD